MSSAVEATDRAARGGAGVDHSVQRAIVPVATGTKGHRAGSEAGRRGRWLAFAAVLAAAVMDLLDSTITQVAAPAIRRELGGSYAVIEWVTAAYALAMAAGLLAGGGVGAPFGPGGGLA